MPCPFVKIPCKTCGHYMCTAIHPAKKIGSKRLKGTICKEGEPDCPIYDEAIKIVDEWNVEMGVNI